MSSTFSTFRTDLSFLLRITKTSDVLFLPPCLNTLFNIELMKLWISFSPRTISSLYHCGGNCLLLCVLGNCFCTSYGRWRTHCRSVRRGVLPFYKNSGRFYVATMYRGERTRIPSTILYCSSTPHTQFCNNNFYLKIVCTTRFRHIPWRCVRVKKKDRRKMLYVRKRWNNRNCFIIGGIARSDVVII